MSEEQNTSGCSEESCASCASAGTCKSKKVDMHEPMNMYSSIKKVIGVVSGKGGVGKSLVTASLARMMRAKGYHVGIMDADITGPSIPKMYGLHEMAVGTEQGILPCEAADGTKYLVIHSGSRNLGKQVAELYQKLAINLNRGYGEYLEKRDEIIRTYKEQGRKREIQDALKQLHWQVYESPTSMPEDLCYLEGIYLEDYLHDVEICQAFARRSREKMAEVILERTVMTGSDAFHTIHNYIDIDEMILRKGAIAAHKGEKVLIPINMKDGSILAIGKGNPEWNYSAPHGAGRIMSRTKAKNELNLDEYKKAMEEVYTTSVNENTLDEAPMAYKSLDDIIDVIRESVDVIDVMKPIYNFKASE